MRAATLTMATLAFVLMGGVARPVPADPAVWLRQAYDRYHLSEKDLDRAPGSSSDVVAPHASRSFAALLKRDDDCFRKYHEICALDWDFLVNGQAWELSHVQVGALEAHGDRATLTVTFVSMKSTNRNLYEFVREDGAWRLDDVLSGQSGRAPIRISKRLRDFKSY